MKTLKQQYDDNIKELQRLNALLASHGIDPNSEPIEKTKETAIVEVLNKGKAKMRIVTKLQ